MISVYKEDILELPVQGLEDGDWLLELLEKTTQLRLCGMVTNPAGDLSFTEEEKELLASHLEDWISLLSQEESTEAMIAACQQQLLALETAIKENTLMVVNAARELEQSYRCAALFFSNAEQEHINNVSFLNAELAQLKDLDNTSFIDAVRQELVDNYDRLDLSSNYSLLVMPGYLGPARITDKWARLAHQCKVMLLTDFENLDEADDVMELFDAAQLTGPDAYRSNTVLTCNWLVGRGRYVAIGEEEALYLPPSAALAGKLYKTVMSQVAAGRKFGVINDAAGVKFPLKKAEVAGLEKLGLIPMVQEQGTVMAFSAKTLFDGDNMGLQTYSIVRVFDYVIKVLIDFLNRKSFENFNSRTRKELNAEIVRFLDSIAGAGRLIENFTIRRFEQDPVQKDRIHLDIHLKPYFPAKTFVLKLEGHKEREDQKTEWESLYEQEAA